MHKKAFSVLLTTYNRAQYIPLAIKSVINQDFNNLELLILDDGSTDNTEEIIDSFKDKRIRYIKNKKNIGYAKNLKNGFQIAAGKYVFILSDDDIIMRPDSLKIIYREMEKKQAGFAEIGLLFYNEDFYKPYVIENPVNKILHVKPDKNAIIKTMAWHYSFMSGNVFRKDYINIEKDLIDNDIWWPYIKAVYRNLINHGALYFGNLFIIARNSSTGLISYLDISKNKKFYLIKLFSIYKQFSKSDEDYSYFVEMQLKAVINFLPGIKYYTSNKNLMAVVKAIIKNRPEYVFTAFFWLYFLTAYLLPKQILSLVRYLRYKSGTLRLKKVVKKIRLEKNLRIVLR